MPHRLQLQWDIRMFRATCPTVQKILQERRQPIRSQTNDRPIAILSSIILRPPRVNHLSKLNRASP